MTSTNDYQISELFDLLESSRPATVNEIRNLITDNFNATREPWLVGGLFDYYIQFDSSRCAEILTGISKEPHDKYLIEKIADGIRTPQTRKQSLSLLGHLVRKQPSWLYRIIQHGVFKELIKILKTESDVVVLVTGLLIVITLLPILPTYLTPYVNDVFDVFSRLATWTHTNNQDVAEEQLLHLQVGLYSLFHRLYAMYPCNFLSYLRHNFSSPEKTLVFHHTIKPMLDTVKMHPLLVTASRETEMSPHRWKSKEYHDVIAECSKLSLDVYESGVSEEYSFRPSLPSNAPAVGESIMAPIGPSIISQPLETIELNNLLNCVEESGTVPNTPITNTLTPPNAYETALEATPENTPIQTPVKDRERLVFKLPERASSGAVQHLRFGEFGERKSLHTITPLVPNSTPANSVPSSPLPQIDEKVYHRRDSVPCDMSQSHLRRDSLLFQRLQKVVIEQQQQQQIQLLEPKGLHINIPAQADSDIFQEGPGGPLTPIQPTQFLEEAPPPCPNDNNVPCRGGLHMPDTKSLIDFATRVKRLRFYSQCEESGGKAKVKRSLSCPDIKEEVSAETETPEETSSRPCYEHLFEGITDVWGDHTGEQSPHTLLDECLKKASSLHGGGNTPVSEVRLKSQVELLHNQLLFERHRREAHTLRNRRLANKARRAQIAEEQISTFKTQIHQLEKEIASLKKEQQRHRTTANAKEAELQNVIKDLDSKLKSSKNSIETIEREKVDLSEKLRQLQEDYGRVKKGADEKSALIFSLESEIKHYKGYMTLNTELKEAYHLAQNDIIMLGELCRRQEEVLGAIKPSRYVEDVVDVKLSYEEEIRSLMNALETKSSQFEATSGHIQDLETTLSKKDKIIDDLKNLVIDTGAEYQVQLRAMEDKYEGVKSINHRLELEILNLQHQVSMKSINASSSNVLLGDTRTTLNGGMSPTDSDVTVSSAASAGGQNFAGLSSPERNVFIFGSPQFENSVPKENTMSDLGSHID